MRKKIKSALIYPVFLFILTVIVMLGMFIFIMPRLVKVFAQSEVELPITTKILLAVSKVLSFNIPLTLITAGFLAIFLITLVRSQAGKAILSRIGFHLPVVKAYAPSGFGEICPNALLAFGIGHFHFGSD